MKSIIIISILFLTSINTLLGQSTVVTSGCNVKFEYDAVGNRVQRHWYCWQQGNSQRPAKEEDATSTPLLSELVTIYPNPTNGEFTVELMNDPKDAELIITNIKGNILKKEKILKRTHKSTLSSFASGIYMVQIRSNGMSDSKRVIKK